jgi:hypothetical protein
MTIAIRIAMLAPEPSTRSIWPVALVMLDLLQVGKIILVSSILHFLNQHFTVANNRIHRRP